MTHGRPSPAPLPPLHLLSAEEVVVLTGVGNGLTPHAIARLHTREVVTIRTHIYSIKRKLLPDHNATDEDLSVLLARIAIAAGYVSVPEFPPPRSE